MIKLTAQPRPTQLTDEKVAQLTSEYKTTGKNVWNKPFIKDALLKMSHSKCSYCECRLDEKSNYMEVEHFYPKNLYPDEVVNWANLLPACKRCNGYKSDFDTQKQPIIHAVWDTPSEHFYFDTYRLHEKTPSGKRTIEQLQLNERKSVVIPRFNLGNQLLQSLHDLLDEIHSGADKTSKFKRKLHDLLFQGCDTEEYAALCATVILQSEDYKALKAVFQEKMWWTSEFDDLAGILTKNALLKM
jgi:uncharacterized protein (TIGR02646 family)